MRTKEEIQNDLDNVELEIRSLHEDVKDTSKDLNVEEVKAKKQELSEKRNSFMKELAELNKPTEKPSSVNSRNAEWLKAVAERRSITIGDVGSINQVKTLFKEIEDTEGILGKASYYYGRDASTNIPVLTPIADPTGQAEGASGISPDSTADISVTEIQPKAYVSVLPITAEMLTMGTVDIESELPTIFAKAFKKVMHKGMLNGTGSNKAMKGLFTSASANTAGQTNLGSTGSGASATANTSIKCSQLAKLALEVSAKDESYTIIMNPSVYQGVLADATASEDTKLYKEGLIRDKSIEGVKIILDNNAPKTTASGDVLCVAVPLSRYAIGIANQVVIKPVDVMGDTKTYFQATMFFSGKQVSDNDIYSLVVA